MLCHTHSILARMPNECVHVHVHTYIFIAVALRRASTAIYICAPFNDVPTMELSMELCTVLCCCGVAENGSPYTFFVKPKWWMVVFWIFAVCSLAEAYLRTSPP